MGKAFRVFVMLMFLLAPVAVRAENACFDAFTPAGDQEIIEYADAFERYISFRLSNMTVVDQTEVRRVLSRIRFQVGFKTAAYDQLTRSIIVDSRITKDMLAHYDLLAHEIEHGIQVLGKNRVAIILGHITRILMPGASVSSHIVRTEREAIGAEWDFLNSLPKEVRSRGIEELRNKQINKKLLALLEEGLAKVDLPREQYIDECAKSAKYTMGYQTISEYGVKIAAYSLLALTGYQWSTENDE
jgi:hypothetical protein